MKKILLILLCIPLVTYSQWNIVGAPINGEAIQDWSGSSVSLSTDGNVLAVGAVNNDGSGFNSGHVRVYENVSGTWTQIGSDINGEAANDYSSGVNLSGVAGAAISLNSDGSVIAIGAGSNDGNGASSGHVRVFQNLSGTWTQVGQDIDGAIAGEQFGTSVDLNSDGTILAAGAPWDSGGHVRVYELNSGTWTQRGTDLTAEATGDFFGGSVSINSNGNVLAVGARENDGTASGAGHVRVFSYTTGQDRLENRNVQGTWAQLGSDINGEAINDRSGCAVSIDATGNIVAIGAKGNTANGLGSFSGHVRVFERISGVWTQIGSDIDAYAQGDEFGYSVSLNANGTRVAAGARLNDGNGSFNAIGHVRIFDNISGVWTQVSTEIIGAAVGNEFGSSICLSGDGLTFAAGAPKNSANGLNAGQARVYQDPTLSTIELEIQETKLFPNPANTSFSIESNQSIMNVSIYDVQGKFIKLFKETLSAYNIEELSPGLYFIAIKTDIGTKIQKIIKL